MSKLIWEPGGPTLSGIYWFDNGLRFPGELKRSPSILQVLGDQKYVYGLGGSMPLDMVYRPDLCRHAKYAAIPQPKKWYDASVIKSHDNYAWFKHPKGYVGFGILNESSHNEVYGDWIWLDHPQKASSHGSYVKNNKGYRYCPVQIPSVSYKRERES